MICFKRLFFTCLLFTGVSFNGDAARWYPEFNGQYVFLERNYEVAQNKNGEWRVGVDDDNERLATVSEKKKIEELLVANNIPKHCWGYGAQENWWFPEKDNKRVILFTKYCIFKDEEDDWWVDQGEDVARALPIEKNMIGEFLKENRLEQDFFYQSLDGIEKKIKKLPQNITTNNEGCWMDNLSEILQEIKLEEKLTLRPWYDGLDKIYCSGVYASGKELACFSNESKELYKKISALIKLTQSVAEKISPESTHQIDGYLEKLNEFSKKCKELSDLFARVTTTIAIKKQPAYAVQHLFSVYDGTGLNFAYSKDEVCKRTNAMKKAIESISKKVYLNEAGDLVHAKEGKLVSFDESSDNWFCGGSVVSAEQKIRIKILMSSALSNEFFFTPHIDVVNPPKKNLYLYVDGNQFQYDQPELVTKTKNGNFICSGKTPTKAQQATIVSKLFHESINLIKSSKNDHLYLDSKRNKIDPKKQYDKRVWLRDDGVFMLGDDVAEQFISVMDAINQYFQKEYLEYAQALKIRTKRMKAINFINCRPADFIANVYTQICQGNSIDFATGEMRNKYGTLLGDQIGVGRKQNRPITEIVWLDVDGYWHYGEKSITYGLADMIAKILKCA